MRKLFKKSLACCLALALCFTLFAGAISANALTTNPAYSTEDVTVAPGESTTIKFTIKDFAEIEGVILKVYVPSVVASIDKVTVEGIELVEWNDETGEGNYQVDKENKFIKFMTLANFEGVGTVATLTFDIDVTVDAEAEADEYGYTAPVIQATDGDALVPINGQFGKFTVVENEPEVPVCEHVNKKLVYSTVKVNDTYTCITKEVCTDCNDYESLIREEASLKYNHSLSLQADLTIKFKHYKATGWNSYSNLFMEFEKEDYDVNGNIVGYVPATISEYEVDGSGALVLSYKGVAAKEMGNIIHAKTYGTDKNGKVVLLAAEEYAVKKYAYNQFTKTAVQDLWPLLVDLLNYGAAAQEYTEYNTDNLVNADLTDDLKKLAGEARTYNSIKAFENVNDPNTDLFSRSLVLKSAVEVNFKVTKAKLTPYITNNDYSNVRIEVDYIDTNNVTQHATYSVAEENLELNGTTFVAHFRESSAANMSKKLVARLYNGDTYLGNTTYSIESYAANNANTTSNLGKLVTAMMIYGDSSYNYLNRNK